jgi:hypothetical protein
LVSANLLLFIITGWCSIFNAELALSVTMTAISTLLSIIMLPVNLVLYTTTTYSSEVVKSLDWSALFVSLVVVIGGISSGILCSAWANSTRFNLMANKLGNLAGIALITLSAFVSSSGEDASLWDQDAKFYIGIATPALVGVTIATWMASKFDLDKPERVAVAVEACYQNTGIATSVAITMFSGQDLATAVGVPLFYGICEAVILAVYCLLCWKAGWTKAPANENICVVIATSYEVEKAQLESPNAIEVVYNTNQKDEEDIEDLVFTQTLAGYHVDEESLHERANARLGLGGGDDEGQPLAGNGPIGDPQADVTPRKKQEYATVGLNSPAVEDFTHSHGVSSVKHSDGYRQGSQVPGSPVGTMASIAPHDKRISTDDSIPADGKEIS